MLKGMSLSPIWEKIIENEEDAKKIEESFKRMDEYTKDFQVQPSKNLWACSCHLSQLEIILRIERNTSELSSAVTVRYFGELISKSELTTNPAIASGGLASCAQSSIQC